MRDDDDRDEYEAEPEPAPRPWPNTGNVTDQRRPKDAGERDGYYKYDDDPGVEDPSAED